MKRRFALVVALVLWVLLAKWVVPNSNIHETAKAQPAANSSRLADTE